MSNALTTVDRFHSGGTLQTTSDGAGGAGGSLTTTDLADTGGTDANSTATTGGTAGASATAATGGAGANSGCRIYVAAKAGDDANDGSAWGSALKTLEPALNRASARVQGGQCDFVEIWVADGTYTPTYRTDSSDPRTATFQLVPKVALYGGFKGTESSIQQRQFWGDSSLLSGLLSSEFGLNTNCYHVVTGVTGGTLDGFTISGGAADGSGPVDSNSGAGMYNRDASPIVTHCWFVDNKAVTDYSPYYSYGGAMANFNSSPTLTYCEFTSNTAAYELNRGYGYGNGYGGAIYNDDFSAPTITSCTFDDNYAAHYGGAMYNAKGSAPVVTNTEFLNNRAGQSGGALYNTSSAKPILMNCTFAGNSAITGGGIYNNRTANSIVTNSIFWNDITTGGAVSEIVNFDGGSATVTYSIVEGGYPSGSNISTEEPLFVSMGGDFRLRPGSAAIDAGDGCPSGLPLTDRYGYARWDIAEVLNATNGIDLGAHEYQGTDGVDIPLAAFECR